MNGGKNISEVSPRVPVQAVSRGETRYRSRGAGGACTPPPRLLHFSSDKEPEPVSERAPGGEPGCPGEVVRGHHIVGNRDGDVKSHVTARKTRHVSAAAWPPVRGSLRGGRRGGGIPVRSGGRADTIRRGTLAAWGRETTSERGQAISKHSLPIHHSLMILCLNGGGVRTTHPPFLTTGFVVQWGR